MLRTDFEMESETTQLYSELNRLSVTSEDTLYFLTHPQEIQKRGVELLEYQGRLQRSGVDETTKDTFMKSALNYLGTLTLMRDSLKNNGGDSTLSNILTYGPIFFVPGFLLGSYFTKKLYEDGDKQARDTAYQIFSEMQKHQQSVSLGDVATKVEDLNSSTIGFFERLKEVEEKLDRAGREDGSKQSKRHSPRRSRR
ncbi:MAG: hypothetical protein J4452_03970 [Candidatus Aenigmarchaeota archaeon]|nr:hypothetical protein [Candidatus Aenigmarchaeota archaeon]